MRIIARDAITSLTDPNLATDPNWPFRLRQAYESEDDSASEVIVCHARKTEIEDILNFHSLK